MATDPVLLTILHDSEAAGQSSGRLRRVVVTGLLFGAIGLYLAVIGLLVALQQRWIIVDVLGLGQATLAAIGLGAGATIGHRSRADGAASRLVQSVFAGAFAGGLLALLAVVMRVVDLRWIFIALSRPLATMLTFGIGAQPLAPLLLILGGAVFAAIGMLLSRLPPRPLRILAAGAAAVVGAGVFQELIQIMMQSSAPLDALRTRIYSWEGLTAPGAAIVFAAGAAVAGAILWIAGRTRRTVRPERPGATGRRQAVGLILVLAALVVLPLMAGSYIGLVLLQVGLYILMGMGLNLEIGLAGLLDLGFVAFFAVGAYTMALLTADSPHALAAYTMIPHLSFWTALPLAILMSVSVGILFGFPVLGVRGDYLAVATMGLGEIVRVVVLSDVAAPLLGGAQGILQIPRPVLFGYTLSGPVQLFYLTLAASVLAAFIALRLENSRLGRAWTALRDDEDVAQALGVNLVRVKLLAYGLGAAFAGLAGAIFATMVASVYPSSFQLLISVNVLALIVVGGMGSLPGVVVGAVVLVGLPELLREFGEYRYLFYGTALIVMMRLRPEGLWPSPVRRRELRRDEAELAMAEPLPALVPGERA
ncbi:MAG TPA: branched-chain amino acid ABC transporter permease [Lichenihabitans sp.]|jgi:branched-chain amino acid transport system permease protein|nr:branched-chain amino acid ABC transporter permease [Lichenihabitans sp.]